MVGDGSKEVDPLPLMGEDGEGSKEVDAAACDVPPVPSSSSTDGALGGAAGTGSVGVGPVVGILAQTVAGLQVKQENAQQSAHAHF